MRRAPPRSRFVHCRRATLALLPAAVLLNGCMIGAWDDDRPKPRGPWYGARTEVPGTQAASPATRPIQGDTDNPESTVAITSATPEQIIAAARALLEPAYGPMKYVRREIPNGRTDHLLLTPRYNVSNHGRNYRWLEVSVNFNPDDRRSIVEVEEVDRSWPNRVAAYSLHGGLWLFPPAMVDDRKGPPEHRLLVAILQRLDDPAARITTWDQISP